MNENLTDLETQAPPRITLVQIPYEKDVYLHIATLTRWRDYENELVRDFDGENDWRQMATYVNKTYEDVFKDSYNYAIRGNKC